METKRSIRERIWRLLEERGAAAFPCLPTAEFQISKAPMRLVEI